jgi:predicted RNase H-like HicB family nuclease/DNA-binding XRE family transcriptional regulator
MNYHFKVHKEKEGFWAECIELDGCHSEANSKEELLVNLKEALHLFIEEPVDSKAIFPLPDNFLGNDKKLISIEVEPEMAFGILLRHYRLQKRYTQKQVADKLGMKNIYSYQRLEKKSNPTLSIMKKIKSVFPEIHLESIF